MISSMAAKASRISELALKNVNTEPGKITAK